MFKRLAETEKHVFINAKNNQAEMTIRNSRGPVDVGLRWLKPQEFLLGTGYLDGYYAVIAWRDQLAVSFPDIFCCV